WGTMIGFITNTTSWESLWIPMTMLNIWRIPLLFFVSGMGVYFALQKRDWKQLIMERSRRILLPFLIGMFCIVPIHVWMWQSYYNVENAYVYDPGHLWFLKNIFLYVVILSPVIFLLKRHEQGRFVSGMKKVFSHPLGLLIVVAAFVAEVMIIKPWPYELYATTWHGFYLGLIAFFFGFCFVLSGKGFWQMILTWRWMFLILAVVLFMARLTYFKMNIPGYLLALESNSWIFALFAFAHKYLNRSTVVLRYLSEAAYPVYILHMIFLSVASTWIFPLTIPVQFQFALVLVLTVTGCFIVYEGVIRRVNFIRPLFGLNPR